MNIFPEEYKSELPGILDWFDDRACVRRGSWLGTEFPFKKGWIIEPISDSTLYPAYYIISKYVNENKIEAKEMTEEFFDYVFLSKGKPKDPIWDTIKKDFEYWYPVDINLGGKEHKTVHFPVFLMNHIAIMPNQKVPKGIFVHWWVTQQGKEKISKSKGGAEHINEAATTYGVDAMRIYYAHVGSPFVDIEWNQEAVLKYKNRITNIYKMLQQIKKLTNTTDKNLDNWLKSTLQRTIKNTTDAFEDFNLRIATNEIFFECQKNLQWYLKRGGSNTALLEQFSNTWIKLMTPVTPHLAEELWSANKNNFVSNESYPLFNLKEISELEEVGEYLISSVTDDISEILKVTKMTPKKIFIYTTPHWKQEIFVKAIKQSEKGKIIVGDLIKEAMKNTQLKTIAKQVSQYVSKLPSEILKLNKYDKKRYIVPINEPKYLIDAQEYFQKIFSCEIIISSAEEKNLYDPATKARFAKPLRPAIYIE
jgi:leucyl-tRNA synthetase